MKIALNWPEKRPQEVFINGADWSLILDGETIASVAAALVAGTVVLTAPAATSFAGAIQSVWVTGGTPGKQTVRLTATLSDGRVHQQDFVFMVVA